MTSLSVVQPYVDKENTQTEGLSAKASRSQVRGLSGKVFQNGPRDGTPMLTPRRALGDINSMGILNKGDDLKLKNQQPAPVLQLFKKPALKVRDPQPGNRVDKTQAEEKQKPLVTPFSDQPTAPVTEQPDVMPPIERMNIYNEDHDLDHKFPLRHLGISKMIRGVRQWRPYCLFGVHPDSDGEDEKQDEEEEEPTSADLELDLALDALMDFTPDELTEVEPLDADLSILSLDIESALGPLELSSGSPLTLPSPSRWNVKT